MCSEWTDPRSPFTLSTEKRVIKAGGSAAEKFAVLTGPLWKYQENNRGRDLHVIAAIHAE